MANGDIKPKTKDIGRIVEGERLQSRSKLYQWLYANYDDLSPVLNVPRAPWGALVKAASKEGHQNTNGRDFTRQTMMETWRRVHRDKQPPVVAVGAKPIPVEPTQQVGVSDPPKRRFEHGTLRGHTPSKAAEQPKPEAVRPPPDDTEKALAEFLAANEPRTPFKKDI